MPPETQQKKKLFSEKSFAEMHFFLYSANVF